MSEYISLDLDQVLKRCMEKDPDNRFQLLFFLFREQILSSHRDAGDQDSADRRRIRLRHDTGQKTGATLRAYDKASGREVDVADMPAGSDARR